MVRTMGGGQDPEEEASPVWMEQGTKGSLPMPGGTDNQSVRLGGTSLGHLVLQVERPL